MRDVVIVSGKGVQWREKIFVYPIGSVSGQEVTDKTRAEKAISDWALNEMKGRTKSVVIQIHEDLIFRKSVAEKEIESFLAEIPIDPEKMAKSVLQKGNLWEVAVIDIDLPDLVTKGLEAAKIKISGVEPKFSMSKLTITPEEKVKENGGNSSLLPILMGVVLIVVLGVMGVVIWKSRQAALPQTSQQTQTETLPVEVIPTVTSEEEIIVEAKNLNIMVLNGSGVTGKAAEAKEFLLSLGYTDVTVGNAEADQATSEAQIKAEAITAWPEFGADLRSKYLVTPEAGELNSDNIYDVVITLGRIL